MTKRSRDKGAGFENEISRKLRAWIGALTGRVPPPEATKRKLGQARDAGNDLDVGNPNQPLLVIECKRRKTLGTVYSWLTQADAAVQARFPELVVTAGDPPHPMVIAREDHGEPLVILHLDDFMALAGPAVRDALLQQEVFGGA